MYILNDIALYTMIRLFVFSIISDGLFIETHISYFQKIYVVLRDYTEAPWLFNTVKVQCVSVNGGNGMP